MKEKLIKFMTGRYGADALSKFMVFTALGCMVLSLIIRHGLLSSTLNSAALVILIISYFRMFSKNIKKRYDENIRYWNLRNKVVGFFKTRKTHHIYKCPECKQKIRIPRGKGKIEITCPKCQSRFVKRS